ncbi:hypothetical protein ACHAXM_000495 [Skeletonema potamos]
MSGANTPSSLRRSPVKEEATRISHLCQPNTWKMCMILSITIGAAGLHFIDIIYGSIQQGYYLETSLRIGKNADITDLALSNETNSIIQLSMPTKASGAVDSREGDEEHQLDSAVAVLENTGAAQTSPRQHGVRFIPFPHKTLGSGAFVQCQWTTGRMLNASSELLDFTQRNTYTDGVCTPPTLKNTLHIFSSAEAI